MRKEKITEGLLNQVEKIRLFLKAVRNLSGLEHRIIVNKAVIEACLTAPRSDCIETKSGKGRNMGQLGWGTSQYPEAEGLAAAMDTRNVSNNCSSSGAT